jgi:hypothetical protein
MKKPIASSRSANWGGRLSVLLVVALLLPLMGMATKPEVTPRAQLEQCQLELGQLE